MKTLVLSALVFFLSLNVFCQELNVNQNLAQEITTEFKIQNNPIQYAIEQSNNGSMDFSKILSKEKGILFLYKKVAYNRDDFTILLWGMAAKKIGIESWKTAKQTWQGIYDAKLKGPDLKALKIGYLSID